MPVLTYLVEVIRFEEEGGFVVRHLVQSNETLSGRITVEGLGKLVG